MKRRIRRMVNFVATNLLVFAIYLNFFHKDRHEPRPADSLKRPAFGDTDQKKDAIRAHRESSIHLKEQAALADPVPDPANKF